MSASGFGPQRVASLPARFDRATGPGPAIGALPPGLAMLARALNDRLVAGPTVTRALRDWCGGRGLSDGRINVELLPQSGRVPPDAEALRWLRLEGIETATHRRVRIFCDDLEIAEADNWYVPQRLTHAMNTLLETTDIPFGTVVEPLRPWRRTVGAVLPESGTGALAPAPDMTVLEHRAVMADHADRPLCVVHERFEAALILPAA